MKPLPFRVRAGLYLQLARLEAAGMPYAKAIATLGVPAKVLPRLKTMQALAARGIDAARAGERSGLFTRMEARLVGAALNAGSPARAYQRLADYYDMRARQAALIKARLTLPAAVLGIALVVQPLPALVGGRIGVAGYAWQVTWPVLLIAVLVALVRGLARQGANSQGKSFSQAVPLYGPIFVRANFRDFFDTLAMMLEAGMPLLEALPAATDTVSDGDIRRHLVRVRKAMEQRATFAAALAEVPYLAGSPVLAFAHTGEESGTLPEMLVRFAATETEAIGHFHEQMAAWVPRIVYALVAIKVVAGIFSSGGLGPRIPTDL